YANAIVVRTCKLFREGLVFDRRPSFGFLRSVGEGNQKSFGRDRQWRCVMIAFFVVGAAASVGVAGDDGVRAVSREGEAAPTLLRLGVMLQVICQLAIADVVAASPLGSGNPIWST
ncbi:hypothetical protein U1Q18_048098, partial [Sarracenia purpurea var. burkii]